MKGEVMAGGAVAEAGEDERAFLGAADQRVVEGDASVLVGDERVASLKQKQRLF